MKLLLSVLTVFILSTEILFSVNLDSLIKKVKETYHKKEVNTKVLDLNNLKDLIDLHLQNDPNLKIYKANEKSADYFSDALESSFMPNLIFSTKAQDYDTYHREVSVYKRIPVKYDNDNPVVTNINLPNGGQGLIWLPRPIAWEKRNINLKTSASYRSREIRNSLTLNYKTAYGLQINAFDYEVDYRLHPETYGYPWNARLNSSVMMPLFKNFGYTGSEKYTQLQIQEINTQISKESYEAATNDKVIEIFHDYFNLYYTFKKLRSLDSLRNILQIQIEDVDLLISESRIPLSEGVNIKSRYRQMKNNINFEMNRLIYISNKLNVKYAGGEDLTLFIPVDINIDKVTAQFYKIFKQATTGERLQNLINEHPAVNIAEYKLRQQKLKVEHAKNQTLPEINFSVSGGTFQESLNYLGHNSAWNAVRHTVDDPSGFIWTLNLQYVLPTGKADENFYKYALENKTSSTENLKQTRKTLSDDLKEYIYQVNDAYEQIQNYRENLKDINDIISKNAYPLFEKQRINRYDYYTYLSELESARLRKIEAQKTFINYVFLFSKDMNIDLNFMFK